ncbi:DUF6925 family protein [Fodinicurvata halophila]|uniref:DUF6925 family protein n=1 Tax=Fodinicurvata halophila TaxID=1419723 RepID=A0ABV8UGL5_9PROT
MTESEPVFNLLEEHLLDPGAGWSVGSFGAIGEFMRDPKEAVDIHQGEDALCAVTARGGLRLQDDPELRPVAYEHANARSHSWSQAVALCLPEGKCHMSARSVLSELGPDAEALREQDRQSVLFDLGLSQVQVDVCVRCKDEQLIADLRSQAGRSVLEADNPAMGRIVSASPHRVFRSRFARAEVYQPIPPADGRSPEGPHTHILPKLLRSRRTHAATAPIPKGWVPAAHLFPAHPAKDLMGRPTEFDAGRHTRFQELLEQYGVAHLQEYKRRILQALHAGQEPPIPSGRFEKAVHRVTMRQHAMAA